MKRVDFWLNYPIDIKGEGDNVLTEITHIDTIHEDGEYVENADGEITFFNEMDDTMLVNAIKTLEHIPEPIVGRKVAFNYMGKRYEKEIVELYHKFWDSWCGDLGFADDSDDKSDGFLIHGDTDENRNLLMQGLVVQYDSCDGMRHGYIKEVEVL